MPTPPKTISPRSETPAAPDSRGVSDSETAGPKLLHQLFESSAERFPDRVALEFQGRQMSYRAVEARANQLARFLQARKIGPGNFVAILLPRSLELHLAWLGILKCGAAYVPLDPDYPLERISYILDDGKIDLVLTVTELAGKCSRFQGPVVRLDQHWAQIEALSGQRLELPNGSLRPGDVCYVIYTSGSTGRPKGVAVEHRSVCNFIRAEGAILQIRPSDRVFQGFSIAFDASIEEIWLAFFSGATLVVATWQMVRAGAELSHLLTENNISVFSCVPTTLSMMDADVPTLRLLILGGEVFSHDLMKRWWKPDRRIVNTYGPTETTVVATWTDCHPQDPVTIGKPLPNYFAYILNSALEAVAPGETGELYVGGLGVARGYVNHPELTRERFLPDPFATDRTCEPRMYRTGDLARWTANENIEFIGRADDQVKIRGYRVELSEIESVLLRSPQIQNAVVSLREDTPGISQLVAYVVLRGPALDEDSLLAGLKAMLPAFMVPTLIEPVEKLPVLPSGKIDRKNLPAPRSRTANAGKNCIPPQTSVEQKIFLLWAKLFAPQPISITDDFFIDLGGHSLLAARAVSELRRSPEFSSASIMDIYENPSIQRLARRLEARSREPCDFKDRKTVAGAKSGESLSRRHFLCGLLQLPGLYLTLGLFSLQWLAPYVTYSWMRDNEYDVLESISGSLAILFLLYPALLLLSIAVKWIVIGRYKPGRHQLWGTYYFRWWLVNNLLSAIPIEYLSGTPLLNIYLRLMGARIGSNVFLGTTEFAAFDLLTIGNDSSIGTDASLVGYTIENGELIIGSVTIGQGCFVGTRAVIRENCVMQDNTALEDLSLLSQGKTVPSDQTWLGSPAQPTPRPAPTNRTAPQSPNRLRKFSFSLLYAAGLFVFPMFFLAAIFPGMMVMNYLNELDDYYSYLACAPIIALSFIVLLGLEIVLMKWLLLGRVKPGEYDLHSFFYFRKWFVDQLLELSLDVLGPLYSTLYLAPWYRLLGAKLGANAEVSTASFISPDLLAIGDESFIADSVSLGAARVRDGKVIIARNTIGKRSFIGNSALLPPGSVIADNCLIGCLSRSPDAGQPPVPSDSSWLGSPSFPLPQRQLSAGFSEETTFKPSFKLRVQRTILDFIRVILPSTGFVVLTCLLLSAVVLLHDEISPVTLLLLFPILYAGCGLLAALAVIAAKWILIGKYRPAEKPLWCTFVWRNELVTSLHEDFSDMFLTSMLAGTPYLPWFLRALGARIGKRVFLETTQFTEYDLVEIGDDVALNLDCTIQTHLFEDRVFKMSNIVIESGCTVGALSLVLYDTRMERDSSLSDLSLLMKGETLPPATRWEGIPARSTGNGAPAPPISNLKFQI